MARADVFVFLDDAQYSKNSYINRVQIDAHGLPRWLTVPVSYQFGDPINRVRVANAVWHQSHRDVLRTFYAQAPAYREVSDFLFPAFERLPDGDIAAANQILIETLAGALKLRCRCLRSSEVVVGDAAGDDRLIAILRAVGPNVTYLSGMGGANYQDPEKFARAGISFNYNDFTHPRYDQGHEKFLPGLSVLDALFRLGFERTAALVSPVIAAA